MSNGATLAPTCNKATNHELTTLGQKIKHFGLDTCLNNLADAIRDQTSAFEQQLQQQQQQQQEQFAKQQQEFQQQQEQFLQRQQQFEDKQTIQDFRWCMWQVAASVRNKIASAAGVQDIWSQLDTRRRELLAKGLGITTKLLRENLDGRTDEAHPDRRAIANKWPAAKEALERQGHNRRIQDYQKLLAAAKILPRQSRSNQ